MNRTRAQFPGTRIAEHEVVAGRDLVKQRFDLCNLVVVLGKLRKRSVQVSDFSPGIRQKIVKRRGWNRKPVVKYTGLHIGISPCETRRLHCRFPVKSRQEPVEIQKSPACRQDGKSHSFDSISLATGMLIVSGCFCVPADSCQSGGAWAG